uniref:MADF domain-containing protein n=1 Tax=Anopheles funestus TaxID=62324 RepID=A0A182RAP0_ANOFN
MSDPPTSTRSVKIKPRWNTNSVEDVLRFIVLVKQHPKLLARISPERLLPEWEKLVPVTGISANEMSLKWNRLCDKYRAELRREIRSTTKQFKSNWAHFQAMEFIRPIEEKRIRIFRRAQTTKPAVNVRQLKVERVTPPPKPHVLVVSQTSKANPSGSGRHINSSMGTCRQSNQPVRRLLPIEKVLNTENAKVRCSKQDIKEDLQLQAGRVIATRNHAIHRIPLPDLTVESIRDAPDNDYDFLMIRIYPLLAIMPPNVKRLCYERMQKFAAGIVMQQLARSQK